jgi:hypothetical protein
LILAKNLLGDEGMKQLAMYFEDDTKYNAQKSEIVHLNIM